MSRFKKFARPPVLYPVFSSVDTLRGIGRRMADIIGKHIGDHVIDLLRHKPTGLIHRHRRDRLESIEQGEVVTLELIPVKHDIPPRNSRRPYKVICHHASGHAVDLAFFHARGDYLQKQLPPDQPRLVSGRAEWYQSRLQIAHPDYIVPSDRQDLLPAIEPVYPLTAGLTARVLRLAMLEAVKLLPDLPEWIPPSVLERFRWPSWQAAMVHLHAPSAERDLSAGSPGRARLAFDELLANQLALGMVKRQTVKDAGREFKNEGKLVASLLSSLPFRLTGAQERVISEIMRDQQSSNRMLRLLQGDVGSGKTLVALVAMLNVAESGAQAAIIAPTEVLARQHHETITGLLAPTGETPVLLTGKMKPSQKREAIAAIGDGRARIIIGTHALISDQTQFHDLGLVVIDEQHRFGVRQRLVLGEKGATTDVLLMTATPIPRTLAMTAYGDLTSSILDEKPAGRRPVETVAMPIERMEAIIARLRETVSPERQAYWICPLIEESDTQDIAAAEERFASLSASLSGLNPVLLHGRMKTAEKDAAMERFRQGESCLLVATTVIEVGVDVPAAKIMIIEHAERFGLAQLHQLRGRVGRGEGQSSCILLYRGPLGEISKSRLAIMRETDDGFRIAAEDLRLRGPGEMLGQRQSGDPEFVMADLVHHEDLLALAHGEAERILSSDAELDDPAHKPLQVLLALFERDRAVSYLAGG